MGGSTGWRISVAVMVVWAIWAGLGALGSSVVRWSPALGEAISSSSLILLVPILITTVVRVLRRRLDWARFIAAWAAALAAAVAVTLGAGGLPGGLSWVVAGVLAVLAAPALAFWVIRRLWPALPDTPPAVSLHLDRVVTLLEEGEQPIAAVEVRVARTESMLLVIGSAMVASVGLLGFAALSFGMGVFVLLLLGVVFLPLLFLTVAIGNGLAERAARHGGRHAIVWSYPRSRGRRRMWPLVPTSRRPALVREGLDGRMDLIWHVPRSALLRAAAAGRSLRTLDPTMRLHFTDGSSIRLTAPDAGPLLAAIS